MINVLNISELLRVTYLLKNVTVCKNLIRNDEGSTETVFTTIGSSVEDSNSEIVEVFIEKISTGQMGDFSWYLHFKYDGEDCELQLS